MSVKISTPKRSASAGSKVRGAIRRTRAPIFDSRLDVGARHAAVQRRRRRSPPSGLRSSPRRRRMVSASSRAWVGCSWLPSPALTTQQSSLRDSISAAPESWWRTTRMSGRMALSVVAVSISVSPLETDEVLHRHVHHVGAQPLARQLERALGAGGGLEEQVDEGAALEQGDFFSLARPSATYSSRQIEQRGDLADRKAFDSKQMACLEDRCGAGRAH